MKYPIANPLGLDVDIDKIQSKLYDELSALWDFELDAYPRCYTFKKAKNKTISYYMKKNEYKSLIHSERNKFFFLAENDFEQTGLGFFKTKIDLYFIVNLDKCKPNLLNRGDEEVRTDVLNVLEGCGNIGLSKKVVVGVDKVFMTYDYKENLDMQPIHCFKIELTIPDFNPNQKKC
jgi:hypothetical protein